MIQQILAIWSLVPLPFLKPAWTSKSLQFTYCWSLAWRILSITLLAYEMSVIVQQFEHSLTLPFFNPKLTVGPTINNCVGASFFCTGYSWCLLAFLLIFYPYILIFLIFLSYYSIFIFWLHQMLFVMRKGANRCISKCSGGLIDKSCPPLATTWTVACQVPLSMEFPAPKNTGVGCHFLFHGIFLAQGSNPCLILQADSLPLSHQRLLHKWIWQVIFLLKGFHCFFLVH